MKRTKKEGSRIPRLPTADATTPDSAIDPSRLRQAWSEYLRGFAWDHFATLTFARTTTPEGARRAFVQVWHRVVARLAQRPVPYFFVVERGGGGMWHIHALLSGTQHVPLDGLESAWKRYGRADIQPYDPMRGAAFYLTKSLPDPASAEHYDVSKRLPPLLRRAA